MLFSSLEFLYLFLPLTLIAYFCCPRRARNYVLLVSSLIFYCASGLRFLPLMLSVALADYAFGLLVFRARQNSRERAASAWCTTAVISNAAVLFVFKYADALLAALGMGALGLELPVGISFYTFQATSYVIDVRRGAARVQKNPFLFVTYVALFPQLIAGPIVRYCEVDGALSVRQYTLVGCAEGVRLFCVGLSKKMLLANGAGECFSRMALYASVTPTALGAWLGVLFFAFQIYFDFSGYSDMARGLGKIFGFEFPENFRYPYISRSISEFWRRWHITLSSWFREYVYIPLGGNRRGRARTYLNLLAVWSLTGLWHGAGANFLAWGLYFFVIISLEKAFVARLLDKAPRAISFAYTAALVLFGWAIFACDGESVPITATAYVGQMLGVGCPLANGDTASELLRVLPFLAVLGVSSTPLLSTLFARLAKRRESAHAALSGALAVLSLLICTAYLADSGYNPFLYFRF